MMKGLNFNLRTLFVITAILAGVIYFGWRINKWYSTGKIFNNGFAIQIEADGQGLLFTITGSNLPLESFEFALRRKQANAAQSQMYSSGAIRIAPCSEKQIRVQRISNPGVANGNQDLSSLILLPQFLDSSPYELELYHHRTYLHVGVIYTGNSCEVLEIKDAQNREYKLWISVNPL